MSNAEANARATGSVVSYVGKRGTTLNAKLRLPDGSQKKIKLGTLWDGRGRPPAGFLTHKMAEDQCRDLVTDAGRGLLTVEPKLNVLFEQAADEYVAWVAHDRKRKHSTVESYKHVIRATLKPWFRGMPIEKITAKKVDALRKKMLEDGKSASSINTVLIITSGILKRAQRNHGLKENVAAQVERQPVKSSDDIDTFNPDQIAILAIHMDNPYRQLAIFAAYTGLRISEQLNLRWSDVNLDGRLVQVRSAFVLGTEDLPKSNKVRSVPLVDLAKSALLEIRDISDFTGDDDFVFCQKDGSRLTNYTVRRHYKAARESAGLKPLVYHSLRHVFGTLAVQVFPLSDVQAMMGHSSITTTMKYVHSRMREDDADKLNAYIVSRLGGEPAPLKLVEDPDDEEGLKAA